MTARRLLAAVTVLCLLLSAIPATPALAHAILLQSSPADGSLLPSSPATVSLVFSEPVQPIGGGIIVVAPSGKRVERGTVRRSNQILSIAIAAHQRGSYLVLWQVISGDTHPVRGRLVFSVGHQSATADVGVGSTVGLVLQAFARWMHEVGYALGFGPFALYAFVLPRRRFEHQEVVAARLWKLVTVGLILLVLAEPVSLLAQTASLDATGVFSPDLAVDILASSFGRVLAQRLGVAFLLWAVLGMARLDLPRLAWVGLVPGLALGLIDGEASHAISSKPAWLGMACNMVHVAAMGAWIGGLFALAAVIPLIKDESTR